MDRDKTIFVGANNSGKTSAAQIFPLFLGAETFSIHDFSGDVWEQFDQANAGTTAWPTITLDLWFEITANDLHRVIDLLPSLNWSAGPVGVRLQYAAKEPLKLFASFQEARQKAKAPAAGGAGTQQGGTYQGWPKSMTDFLTKKLRDEFQIQYFVIDRSQFDADYRPKAEFVPAPLSDESGRGGAAILQSLVRVDFMKAQRHLSDEAGPGRAEDLSRRLSRFYERNLKQPETDFEAMRALADSETQLNAHLASVFKPTLERLNKLGYPGLTNPHLLIKSVLNPESILKGNAHVHYSLRDEKVPGDEFVLPDRYNGLGFKNLIYMVVELLDYHSRWQDQKENQALLHLIIIEEPEAHLHAQLQQVFIREILKIIPDSSPGSPLCSQLIVTTHSPHIIYECGFTPIRYFRRSAVRGRKQGSVVLNLSDFYNRSKTETRNFLQRYLKLTHCDLFFADAAVLVEGNVERLLLPAMIPKSAPELQSCYLSILEVGGAFGSGKTTSLVKAMDYVAKTKRPELVRHGQQVACITYTEVAVAELMRDLGHDKLFHISTIHSFLWTLVKPFQRDIRAWVESHNEASLTKLLAEQAGFGSRVQQKKRDAVALEIAECESLRADLSKVRRFTYEAGRDYRSGILGHDDIVKMAPTLILERPLLRTIIAQKYPYFFVDESQDTVEAVVLALTSVDQQESSRFCLGFFGDPMQKIYTAGRGTIDLKPGWTEIKKPENFRCPARVLSVINRIRLDADKLQQTPGLRERDGKKCPHETGTARMFVLPLTEDRAGSVDRVRQYLADQNHDPLWRNNQEGGDVRILVIEHAMAANRLGFAQLHAAFNNAIAMRDQDRPRR